MVEANFLRSNFLQVLDLHIFLQKQPGHWAEVVCIFTFFYIPNGNEDKKMPQLSSENCGWLPHRDSNSVKQNQNLVCYHYTMGQSILILRFCGRKYTGLF